MKSKLIPPFDYKSAKRKVKVAQDAWNTKNPSQVALAYTQNSRWRNRDDFFCGREAIVDFLTSKWEKELNYYMIKELWAYTDNRISVRFEYEWKDAETGQWYRTHGNEHWEFDSDGLMQVRDMSANDIPILERQRKFRA